MTRRRIERPDLKWVAWWAIALMALVVAIVVGIN